MADLQVLSKTNSTPGSLSAEDLLEAGKSGLALGADLSKVPRLFYRDGEISRASRTAQLLKQEVALLSQHPEMSAMKSFANDRYKEERQMSLSRFKDQAKRDLAELGDFTEKLHIVEVEAIQHMFPNGKQTSHSKIPGQVVADAKSDTLTFPDDGEVWMDELDHYHMKTKGCSAE